MTMKLYRNLLFVLLLFALVAAEAQAPHKFSYQAVVRNQGNALVVNRQNLVLISITGE